MKYLVYANWNKTSKKAYYKSQYDGMVSDYKLTENSEISVVT